MDNEITINDIRREELNLRLYDLIHEMRVNFGITGKFNVHIVDDDNCFYNPTCPKPNLTGGVSSCSFSLRNFKLHLICLKGELTITRGIFKKVNIEENSDEFKSLIAHELSHIFNKDEYWKKIFFGAWGLTTILMFLLASIISNNFGISILTSIIYIWVFGVIFRVRLRRTETRCDRDAVITIKNPEASKRALQKIHVVDVDIHDKLTTLNKIRICKEKIFDCIFLGSTHPSIEERIKNIESLKTN